MAGQPAGNVVNTIFPGFWAAAVVHAGGRGFAGEHVIIVCDVVQGGCRVEPRMECIVCICCD